MPCCQLPAFTRLDPSQSEFINSRRIPHRGLARVSIANEVSPRCRSTRQALSATIDPLTAAVYDRVSASSSSNGGARGRSAPVTESVLVETTPASASSPAGTNPPVATSSTSWRSLGKGNVTAADETATFVLSSRGDGEAAAEVEKSGWRGLAQGLDASPSVLSANGEAPRYAGSRQSRKQSNKWTLTDKGWVLKKTLPRAATRSPQATQSVGASNLELSVPEKETIGIESPARVSIEAGAGSETENLELPIGSDGGLEDRSGMTAQDLLSDIMLESGRSRGIGNDGGLSQLPPGAAAALRGALRWGPPEQKPVNRRLKVNLDLDIYHARNLYRGGRPQDAESIMAKAVRDWPDDGRPYVVLGRMLQRQRKFKEARRVFESGCQALGGDNAFIWQTWAVLESQVGNLDRARQLFDAATVADARHVAAWHGWAVMELKAGNVKRARELLQKGLKLCGGNEYIYQTLAVMEFRDGRVSEARALFLQATRINGKSAASWLAWALLEAQQGDASATRLLFQRALEASPRSGYVWQAWGLFEASCGRYERARLLLQRGCQLNRKDAALLQALALLEYECGLTGTARELFSQAAAVDPNHQPVWTAWGWLEWKEGRVQRARELYQRAADVDSVSANAARVFHAMAVLEEREESLGLARAYFKRALRVDPSNDVVWRSWAAMEERQGNAVRAEEIRLLRLQQRVEVVESSSSTWDLGGVIGPAIDRMKALFTPSRTLSLSSSSSPVATGAANSSSSYGVLSAEDAAEAVAASSRSNSTSTNASSRDSMVDENGDLIDDFDVDGFLEQRLPKQFSKLLNNVDGVGKSIWRKSDAKGKPRNRGQGYGSSDEEP